MPVSLNNTQVVFNDATTQTTSGVTVVNVGTGISSTGGKTPTLTNTGVTSLVAGTGISVSAATGAVTVNATGSYAGPTVQSFTSSGTFTVPTGITKVKVCAIGGGGGGGGVAVGGNGGNSSFGSSVVGGGGAGGSRGFDNGTECTVGPMGTNGTSTNTPFKFEQLALKGTPAFGVGGFGGAGGSGCPGLNGTEALSIGGVGFVTGLTPGNVITITIGAGGAGGGGAGTTAGQAGYVVVEF